jgi:hypothetical protein
MSNSINNKSVYTKKFKVFIILIFSALSIYFLLISLCYLRKIINPKLFGPSPPDLSSCTHIEIQFLPSTLKKIIYDDKLQILFNTEEIKYLESLKTITIDDPELIKKLAHDIRLASYGGSFEGGISAKAFAYVICYRNTERVTSFTDYIYSICTESGNWFDFERSRPDKPILYYRIPSIAAAFRMRINCASNLNSLNAQFHSYVENEKTYPKSDEWCNTIVRANQDKGHIFENSLLNKLFICPSAGEGKCHYAMNPNCEPNSPGDMVLLFETKAGWNQHGGPELFTFDNHDPKGGCVLLNDGTVKFVRTVNELEALHWK